MHVLALGVENGQPRSLLLRGEPDVVGTCLPRATWRKCSAWRPRTLICRCPPPRVVLPRTGGSFPGAGSAVVPFRSSATTSEHATKWAGRAPGRGVSWLSRQIAATAGGEPGEHGEDVRAALARHQREGRSFPVDGRSEGLGVAGRQVGPQERRKRKRSSRRAAISSRESAFARAAASSIASGRPSSSRQIRATVIAPASSLAKLSARGASTRRGTTGGTIRTARARRSVLSSLGVGNGSTV